MSMHNVVFTVIVLCVSLGFVQPSQSEEDPHHWDVLIYTQQWPATVCKEWKEHNKSHACDMPSQLDTWSIHGIWPTKLGTIGPAFCNRSWHFDPEAIRPIETLLIQYWTNIEADTPHYAFWSHEWSKHGTCAAVLEPLNGEFKYFLQGLNWLQNYTMSRILKEADIVPSNVKGYKVVDIHNAIQSKLAINPAIECRKEDGKNWLVEIRICFDKNLILHNCDGIKDIQEQYLFTDDMEIGILTNCDLSQDIMYPHFENQIPSWVNRNLPWSEPPNRLYVQLYKLVSWLQWFTL